METQSLGWRAFMKARSMGSTGGHFRPSSGKGTPLSLQFTAVVGQTLHLKDSCCGATHLQGHALRARMHVAVHAARGQLLMRLVAPLPWLPMPAAAASAARAVAAVLVHCLLKP